MRELEERLGYAFAQEDLLETALTHSSYANERPGRQSNERLEFLGDAVLGFCAAKCICRLYPSMPEGEMTRLRAELVCEASLHAVAVELGLGRYIRLGKNEECNGGRERVSILADAVEAIIAAIFLDGGLEPAERFIDGRILRELEAGRRPIRTDYKTQLQEILQREGGAAPTYAIVGESGPDHNKFFAARVELHDGAHAEGKGRSKKEAEQNAAKAALALLGE
ncbi:MAG: ribonuclease III [Oscillospiraceae bacterium]|nr:ribonuclease III [Oscillospiraceae bacterium]